MKIGIYLGDVKPFEGGGLTFKDTIIRELLEAKYLNHEFYLFHFGDANLKSAEKVKIVKYSKYYYFINKVLKKIFGYNSNFVKKISKFQKLCFKNKIDALWYLSPEWAEVTDLPYFLTIWDLQHRRQPYFPEVSANGYFEKCEKIFSTLILKASYIITGTKAGGEELKTFYGLNNEKIKTIPFAINNYNENKETNIDIKNPYLFYPAQFWPHKNHINLLKALNIIIHDYKININLVLCGSDKGNLSYIKEKIIEYNLSNNVQVLGFVSNEELIYLYKKAFALIFPTFFGPDNLPPIEAFKYSCPVLASSVNGSDEQLKDAAIFFKPDSFVDIAAKFKYFYEHQELRDNLIANGHKIINELTPSNYLKQALKIFDEFENIRECWSNEIYKN